MVRKAASKTRWQGFERFIAFMIGGKRVLGQAHKATSKKRDDTLGDAQSVQVIAECKARDPAPKKFREKNPKTPYNKLKIEVKWLIQLSYEAITVKKEAFLAYNIKYTGYDKSYIFTQIYPSANKPDNHIVIDPTKKKFTIDVDDIPIKISIDDQIWMCCSLNRYIMFLHEMGYTEFDSVESLMKAWSKRK